VRLLEGVDADELELEVLLEEAGQDPRHVGGRRLSEHLQPCRRHCSKDCSCWFLASSASEQAREQCFDDLQVSEAPMGEHDDCLSGIYADG